MDYIKRFHSLPSLYFFLFFSFGIALCWFLGPEFSFLALVIIFCSVFLLLIIFYKKDKFFFGFSLVAIVITGTVRMWLALYLFNPIEMQLFQPHIDAFQGKIIEADYRDLKSNIYILDCNKVMIGNQQILTAGLVVLSQGKYEQEFSYGDVIRIYGKPELPALPTNPGEFNYRRYLQLNDEFFYFRLDKDTPVSKILSDKGNWAQNLIFNPVRRSIRKVIDSHLSKQSSSIVKALILGERGNLDKGVITDFQKTGVIHVLAISGLHVGFIALMLQFALSLLRVPKKISMAMIILFLVFFVALVNFKAPVVRASLMMSFYYLSKFMVRPQKPLNIISLSGIVILMVQPEQLLLPGFQYSFAAVFGLIYGSDKLDKLFPYVKPHGKAVQFINQKIRTPFIASLSAILATLPLTWYYFGSLQIGAIIANILVIPYIALVLFLCILFLCFAWMPFFPVSGVAFIIDSLINLLVAGVAEFSQLPFIQVITGHPNLLLVTLIVIVILLIFNISIPRARLGLMAIITFLILTSLIQKTNAGKLKLTFINVGQGDATLLQFPNDKIALVDAGNKGFGFDAGERYIDGVLKYNGINELNYLIASHPHSDHIGGFEYIIKNYDVDTLIFSKFHYNSRLVKRILSLAKQKNIAIKMLDAGDLINVCQQTRIYVLHPTYTFEKSSSTSGEAVNNSSIVLKLIYGKNSILLNGDAEKDAELAMCRYKSFLDCDLLKVGHHGSNTSSSIPFLNLAKPESAVISVGRHNKFNHPSPVTILKYNQRKIHLYRTDISGAVEFESDGNELRRINWRDEL